MSKYYLNLKLSIFVMKYISPPRRRLASNMLNEKQNLFSLLPTNNKGSEFLRFFISIIALTAFKINGQEL